MKGHGKSVYKWQMTHLSVVILSRGEAPITVVSVKHIKLHSSEYIFSDRKCAMWAFHDLILPMQKFLPFVILREQCQEDNDSFFILCISSKALELIFISSGSKPIRWSFSYFLAWDDEVYNSSWNIDALKVLLELVEWWSHGQV